LEVVKIKSEMELNKRLIFEDFLGDIDEISLRESDENLNSTSTNTSIASDVVQEVNFIFFKIQ
jgi:hypothetical protein